MRARRRQVTGVERRKAARAFAILLQRVHRLRAGMRLALYIAHGHEADLSIVLQVARQRRCVIYLPIISHYRTHRMEFVLFRGEPLRVNRFGIPEPERSMRERATPRQLDLILLPLVAVDTHGWRLGSGAGYYDRRLAHLKPVRRWRRPRLIGVCYEFQRVAALDHEPWDVPVDAVLTERALHRIERLSQEKP
jgi:5-formyltetrahydrofolate cyclo-ligase